MSYNRFTAQGAANEQLLSSYQELVNKFNAVTMEENSRIVNEGTRTANENARQEALHALKELELRLLNTDFTGAKGDKGDKGTPGLHGIKGEKGDTGSPVTVNDVEQIAGNITLGINDILVDNQNILTDAEKTAVTHTNRVALDNVSGTNTGDQSVSASYLPDDTDLNTIVPPTYGYGIYVIKSATGTASGNYPVTDGNYDNKTVVIELLKYETIYYQRVSHHNHGNTSKYFRVFIITGWTAWASDGVNGESITGLEINEGGTLILSPGYVIPTQTTLDGKLAKTTNITAIDDTGIADGEIMVANLTSKKLETSNKTIVTVLGTDDTTVPTSKAVKDVTDTFIKKDQTTPQTMVGNFAFPTITTNRIDGITTQDNILIADLVVDEIVYGSMLGLTEDIIPSIIPDTNLSGAGYFAVFKTGALAGQSIELTGGFNNLNSGKDVLGVVNWSFSAGDIFDIILQGNLINPVDIPLIRNTNFGVGNILYADNDKIINSYPNIQVDKLAYLSGVSSDIQTQLNGKLNLDQTVQQTLVGNFGFPSITTQTISGLAAPPTVIASDVVVSSVTFIGGPSIILSVSNIIPNVLPNGLITVGLYKIKFKGGALDGVERDVNYGYDNFSSGNDAIGLTSTTSITGGMVFDIVTGGSTPPVDILNFKSSNLTASTILITDVNKQVISATTTTYPSLTELAYLKGATSGIQTQLNVKQGILTSGSNIKTINSSSILGSGNLSVAETTTTIGALLNGATVKTALLDADKIAIRDSVGGTLQTITKANLFTRNVADGVTAITINQKNASSTGNILDLQFNTVTKSTFNKDGWLGIGTTTPTAVFSVSEKGAINADGGYMVKLTNKTGATSVKGTVVDVSSTTDNAFQKVVDGVPDAFGVVYEDGIADGAECWVVTSGIAEVLFIGSTTRKHLARTFTSAEAGYITGYALSEAVPTTPFATDKHFCEIGHVLQSRTGAGLAKVVLHFN